MSITHRANCIFCIGVLAVVASGCATVIHGTKQTVAIHSVPEGATATILPEGSVVTTPAEIKLSRKNAHTVLFERDGFARAIGYLDRVTSGAVYGNLLLGGFIGASVDNSNGAAYRLTPDPLEVELEPLESEPNAKR